jgi:iron complex transport system substrate-binding protein
LFALLLLCFCTAPAARGVKDQVGEVVAPGPVRRLVPLAPDVTELAFALGAGEKVVAVTAAADFPPEVARLPRIAPGDAEAILALKPDLVLATTAGNDMRVIERLRQLGTRVCTMDVTSCARLEEACRLAGELTGLRAQGEHLAGEIGRRCRSAAARARTLPRRRALYVVWWEPLIVAAPGTFHDDLLRHAGLANLAPASGGRYPRVDPELLLDPRLEVVVVPDERDLRAGYRSTLAMPVGQRLASGNVRVIWLPADPASRPGPRLPEALEALVAAREAAEREGSGVRGPGSGRPPTRVSTAAPAGGKPG